MPSSSTRAPSQAAARAVKSPARHRPARGPWPLGPVPRCPVCWPAPGPRREGRVLQCGHRRRVSWLDRRLPRPATRSTSRATSSVRFLPLQILPPNLTVQTQGFRLEGVDPDGSRLLLQDTQLLANADSTVSNIRLVMESGQTVLGAATGTTLTLDKLTGIGVADGTSLVIGSSTLTGTVVIDSQRAVGRGSASVSVNGGTVREAWMATTTFSPTCCGRPVDHPGRRRHPGPWSMARGSSAICKARGGLTSSDPHHAASDIEVRSGNFAGDITGSIFLLQKTGPGTLVLSGSNSYLGSTFVTEGTLQAGSTGAIPTGSDVIIADTATLDLNNFNQTIGSLEGSSGATIHLGRATLTTGSDDYTRVYAGTITGAGSLVKTGDRLMILTGINTYTGGTTIASGHIAIENPQGLGTGAITIDSGELLTDANMTLANDIRFGGQGSMGAADDTVLHLTGNVTLQADAQTFLGSTGPYDAAGTISVDGGISVAGPNTELVVAGGHRGRHQPLGPDLRRRQRPHQPPRNPALRQRHRHHPKPHGVRHVRHRQQPRGHTAASRRRLRRRHPGQQFPADRGRRLPRFSPATTPIPAKRASEPARCKSATAHRHPGHRQRDQQRRAGLQPLQRLHGPQRHRRHRLADPGRHWPLVLTGTNTYRRHHHPLRRHLAGGRRRHQRQPGHGQRHQQRHAGLQPQRHAHGGQHHHRHRRPDPRPARQSGAHRRQHLHRAYAGERRHPVGQRLHRRHHHRQQRRHARRHRHGGQRPYRLGRHAGAGQLHRHAHGQRQPVLRARFHLPRRGQCRRRGRPRQCGGRRHDHDRRRHGGRAGRRRGLPAQYPLHHPQRRRRRAPAASARPPAISPSSPPR